MKSQLTSVAIFSFALTLAGIGRAESRPLTVPDILDAKALKDGSDGKAPVDPCVNFYEFACGQWIESTDIPADKSRLSHQATALLDKTDEMLSGLIANIDKQPASKRTAAANQVADYYATCMDFDKTTSAAEALLRARLAEVQSLARKEDLPALLASLHREGVSALFAYGSGQDLNDSKSVIGFLDQGSLGLPEPSYYVEKDAKSIETRAKYQEHIAKLLTLAGHDPKTSDAEASAVMALETALATTAMSFDERQDPSKINHPITREALAKLAPSINWNEYFRAIGAPVSKMNMNEPDYFKHMSELLARSTIDDLRAYLSWHVASRYANRTSPALDEADFAFWRGYMRGEAKMKPRWKRCTQTVSQNLGYAVAEVYVQTVDTQAIRSKINEQIDEIMATFGDDLNTLTDGPNAWLDKATKAQALVKLKKLSRKVGAPERWRDYSSLTTDRHSYLSNDLKATSYEFRRDIAKIGKPVDRDEWYMMPWEVNAYYDPPQNEFVFPFGILQPPSFDLKASDGANLGAFGGGTIGHELTHGFDNDGRQYDGDGNVKDWWTNATKRKFEERGQCFIKQGNAYRIASVGLNVDGKRSLSENLADQGGVKFGYLALQRMMGKRSPAPLWNGKYDENQQYWLAYAQSWCGKTRPESLRQQIKTDPHPPEEFRVNAPLMNRPEFQRDWKCASGTPMAPKRRCSIW